MTHFDKLAWQRKRRQSSGNIWTKKYEKTRKGFLMRCYRNMKSRVEGIQKRGYDHYFGKPILRREDFYTWALDSPDFNKLFEAWEEANYSRRLTPSINRINPDEGYTLDNIEWITQSENSRLGGLFKVTENR